MYSYIPLFYVCSDYNKFLFPGRDLKALSVHPQLVEPSHEKQQSGFTSDTFYSAYLNDIIGDDM